MWASRRQHGFTIVELLIVIVVIAILAAVTIVAFNSVQNRARAAQASAALSQARKQLEIYKVNNSVYPTTGNLGLAGISDGAVTYQYTSDGTTYCITGTATNVSYKATQADGPSTGGCQGHGQGGVAAITNLANDPRATTYTVSGNFGWRNSRWAGGSPAAGSYSLITGASDGPAGIATYARKTWSVAPPALGNSGDTGFDNTGARLTVTPGESYAISCYLRPSVNRNFNIGVYQYTSADVAFTIPRFYGINVAGPANQWTRVSDIYTVPTGVGRIGIVCDSGSAATNGAVNWAAGSTLDGTGLMVVPGSTTYGFADGASSDWVWNGTPNNSTSTGPAL